MKLIDLPVNDFIQEVDSNSPAPGGGSVSALAATLGASLLRMVGHLTVGKKKFLALPAETQTEFNSALETLLQIKDRLMVLIDADTASFNQIMSAFQLPKETEEAIAIRNQKIQEATLGAIQVPLEVANLSLKALQNIAPILKSGNKNALSDLAVGTLMLFSGLEGAVLNVEINLAGLDDTAKADTFQKTGEILIADGRAIQDRIVSEVHRRLKESRA